MDNKIRVTGKVESYGQTINRLTQKGPKTSNTDYKVYLVTRDALSKKWLGDDRSIPGHVFIGAIDNLRQKEAWGFYPDPADTTFEMLWESDEFFTGVIKDNLIDFEAALSKNSAFRYKEYDVSGTQYLNALTFIRTYHRTSDYALLTNNCAHAAFKALLNAGLELPFAMPTKAIPWEIFDQMPTN